MFNNYSALCYTAFIKGEVYGCTDSCMIEVTLTFLELPASGCCCSHGPIVREAHRSLNFRVVPQQSTSTLFTSRKHANIQQTDQTNQLKKKVRTLLVSIFCVRFVMVGMEVVVPLVSSRMRGAVAKANAKAESADKVMGTMSIQNCVEQEDCFHLWHMKHGTKSR